MQCGTGEIFPLLRGRVVVIVRIQREHHVVAAAVIQADFLSNPVVKRDSLLKAERTVHKVLLVVHDNQASFARLHAPFASSLSSTISYYTTENRFRKGKNAQA